jgi:hypothetical protein
MEDTNRAIEHLIETAYQQKITRTNVHGVSAFDMLIADLPSWLVFDRMNLCDVVIMDGNGSAQVRRRPRKGTATVVYDIQPVITFEA